MTEAHLRLLFYNAYLLRTFRLPVPGRGRFLMAKPGVDERARELGDRLAGRYDVMAFCEVFDHFERGAILAAWKDRPAAPEDCLGPRPHVGPGSFAPKSSGLFTLVEGHQVSRNAARAFSSRGHRWKDSDAWANKGVLLVEVELGLPGALEVYSTHLIAGGGLLHGSRGSDPAVAELRRSQIAELMAFVTRMHRPGNAALVVGDFNIDALAGPSDHADLVTAMDEAGFDDVWVTHGHGPGFTADAQQLREAICVIDPDRPDLCIDPADPGVAPGRATGEAGQRIDYAWLLRPAPSSRVAVAVEEVRRAAFPRHASAREVELMPYLSDHLGLDLALRLVPA